MIRWLDVLLYENPFANTREKGSWGLRQLTENSQYTLIFFSLKCWGLFFLLDFDNVKWYSPIKSVFLSSDKWICTVVIRETVTVYVEVISHRITGEDRKAQIHQDWNQGKVLDKALTYFTVCWLFLKGKSSGSISIALTKVQSLV